MTVPTAYIEDGAYRYVYPGYSYTVCYEASEHRYTSTSSGQVGRPGATGQTTGNDGNGTGRYYEPGIQSAGLGGLEYLSLLGAIRGAMAVASERFLAQAIAGVGVRKAIAGAGSRNVLRAAPRLAREYGGVAGDWSKMVGASDNFGGSVIQIHWYENAVLGLRTEFKQNIPWLVK